MKNCLALTLLTLSTSLFAQTSLERKAEIAGKYWGAVIMASEFKKTECGKTLSIGKKWTDVDGATREIKSSFPVSVQSDLDQFFSKSQESRYRMEQHSMFSKVTPDKCEAAKNVFWTVFDSAATAWKSVR
jgi:hypothetical protein